MKDIKSKNQNGLCYKVLGGIKIGDVFEYVSSTGVPRHYVVSFLHSVQKKLFATILFPDGYAETIGLSELKKDKYIKNIKWHKIYDEYLEEAQMYE